MLLMDLSSWLAAGHEEQIALGVCLLGDVAAGHIGEEHRKFFPGDCALGRSACR